MKRPEPTSAGTKERYEAIAATLAARGAEASAMFGMPSLKLAGKAFAGVFGDRLVFKLEGAPHAEALALAGAGLFDPSGMGRPMKAWVVVPKKHADAWGRLAEAAMAALAGGVAGKAATRPAAKRAKPSKAVAAKKPAETQKKRAVRTKDHQR
ncbi:MAG: hypothetical protein JST92_09510 [Deltaproteobacteria bacterium]|nr:hypothetical protein [Deltaproteobacteria bacterium]